MAERRMFAKSVTNSARFLRMPPSSRLLYYDLGMNADDDGVVEAFTVIRTTGAAEDDLNVLIARGFIIKLNDDLVSYITDWHTNNQLRRDRYTRSVYGDLLVKVVDCEQPLVAGLPSVNQTATNGKPNGNQTATNGIPTVATDKDRLGKNSIGKSSTDKDREDSPASPPAPKEVRHQYGEYKNVLLTDADLEKLKAELPGTYQDYIERLSRYMASKGVSYKSHLATIRNWARKDAEQRQPQQPQKEERTYQYGIYL